MDTLTCAALEQASASKLKELLAGIPWLRNWHVKRDWKHPRPRI